jgi:quinol monooxygenase YgiN
MGNATAAEPLGAATHSAVVELRQYTLKPEQRDVMIDIFERHFVETQEAAGAKVIGHFRDLDHPDRFVWLRGFRDMSSRRLALEAFYGSDLWQEHRDAVNETLVDSENVLLLRPARAGSGFRDALQPRDTGGRAGLVTATVCSFDAPVPDEFVTHFHDGLAPEIEAGGATVAATLVTEASDNDFPALPIREDENVFVWVARFPGATAAETLERSPRWRELVETLNQRLARPPETLHLAPAARSELG